MQSTAEHWVPVVGYEGLYEVSDQGRVRRDGRVLKPGMATNGYWTVSLWCQGAGRTFTIHRLVAEAFIGPRPAGADICHGNGVRSDNRLANLRYDTRLANSNDSLNHGTRVWGERHRCAKLTEHDVHSIRAAYPAQGLTELSGIYGVTPSAIYNAATGVTWKLLKEKREGIGQGRMA